MIFRQIVDADIPSLFAVRSTTRENTLSREDLATLGITEASVCLMMASTHRGWLCEADGRVVGFSIGNCETGELWVVAVLPEYEGRGIGRKLISLVEEWLWSCGWKEAWLTTDPNTHLRAYGFYRTQGWLDAGTRDGQRRMIKKNPVREKIATQ